MWKGKFDRADGSKFIVYVVLDGECQINYKSGSENKKRDSVFIPAAMGILKCQVNLRLLEYMCNEF